MKLGLLLGTVVSLTMMTAAAVVAGQGSSTGQNLPAPDNQSDGNHGAGRHLLAPRLYDIQDSTGQSPLGRPNWELRPTLPRKPANPQPYDREHPGSRKLSTQRS
jgi:hypothetical protein